MYYAKNYLDCKAKEGLIQRALEFWQPRTPRTLSEEDAWEIVTVLYALYLLLQQWHVEDLRAVNHPNTPKAVG